MDYTHILIKPVQTEKSALVAEMHNQVVFYVNTKANKTQVKKAVETAFNVKVVSVNLVRKKPTKRTRHGRAVGTVSGYKKAYISLAEGNKIDLFGGV